MAPYPPQQAAEGRAFGWGSNRYNPPDFQIRERLLSEAILRSRTKSKGGPKAAPRSP
jgi:hypothetical protein